MSEQAPSNEAPRLQTDHTDRYTHVTFLNNKADGIAVRQLYELAASMMETRNQRMLVDLTGLPMASSGLMGMLVTIRKKFLMTGGQLHIASPNPMVTKSFQVMRLDIVLQLFPSVDEAQAKFK
ncbi:MAG: STAS domain-containing protein [Phycisphaera sp.]|nr:STAS domain-containing protein [Phycisphaera sp.]